jgi:hypothetical protein
MPFRGLGFAARLAVPLRFARDHRPPSVAEPRKVHQRLGLTFMERQPFGTMRFALEDESQRFLQRVVLTGRAEPNGSPDAEQGGAVTGVEAPKKRVVVVAGMRLMGFALLQRVGAFARQDPRRWRRTAAARRLPVGRR